MVETRKHPESGLQHPFDVSTNFLSRCPVDFEGCFNCGQADHWQTKFCPEAKNSTYNKTMFFNEMWAHKPHTRKPPRNFDNNNDQYGSSNFLTNQDGNHDGYTTFNQSGNNFNNQSGNNNNVNKRGNNTTFNRGGTNIRQSGNNTTYNRGDNNTNRRGNNNTSNNYGGNYNYSTNGDRNDTRNSRYGPSTDNLSPIKRNIDISPAWMRNDNSNGNGRRVDFNTKRMIVHNVHVS